MVSPVVVLALRLLPSRRSVAHGGRVAKVCSLWPSSICLTTRASRVTAQSTPLRSPRQLPLGHQGSGAHVFGDRRHAHVVLNNRFRRLRQRPGHGPELPTVTGQARCPPATCARVALNSSLVPGVDSHEVLGRARELAAAPSCASATQVLGLPAGQGSDRWARRSATKLSAGLNDQHHRRSRSDTEPTSCPAPQRLFAIAPSLGQRAADDTTTLLSRRPPFRTTASPPGQRSSSTP